MKIRFEEGYKRFYTVEQYEAAKIVIKYMQEYECSENMYSFAKYVINEMLKGKDFYLEKILSIDLETCRRTGAAAAKRWDDFGEGSHEMDIRLSGIAVGAIDGSRVFIEFSTTLTNAYEAGGPGFDRDENHTYLHLYSRHREMEWR